MTEKQLKAALRLQLRKGRGMLSEPDWLRRSAAICDALLSLPIVANVDSVALFWPMLERREVDLRSLDTEFRRRGCRVAYPHMADGWGFRWTSSSDDLVVSSRGFLEPGAGCQTVEPGDLAIVVVPALAITETGQRLGYGAGFYDRALATFGSSVESIGVVYAFELVSSLPVAKHDRAVDWIVTDERTLQARR